MPIILAENKWYFIESNQWGRLYAANDRKIKNSHLVECDRFNEGDEAYYWRFHKAEEGWLLENKCKGFCFVVWEDNYNSDYPIACHPKANPGAEKELKKYSKKLWEIRESEEGYFILSKGFGALFVANQNDSTKRVLIQPLLQKNAVEYEDDFLWNFLPVVTSPSTWMRTLDKELCLKDICLPGTLHAGMYNMSDENPIAQPSQVWFHKWSVYHQLTFGVRYFDFSVKWKGHAQKAKERDFKMDDLFIYHKKTTGPRLRDVLGQIDQFFCEQNEGNKTGFETIILCFSKFEGFTEECNQLFIQLIKEKINPWLLEKEIVGREKISALPLQKLRNKIIVLVKEVYPFSLYYPSAIEENIYKWGEELEIHNNQVVERNSFEQMRQVQTLDFITFDDKESLYLLNWTSNVTSKKREADGQNTIVSTGAFYKNEKQAQHNPLLFPNGKGQKINILLLQDIDFSQALPACLKITAQNKNESSYGVSPKANRRYLIRPVQKVDFCLNLSCIPDAETGFFHASLSKRAFRTSSPNEIFKLFQTCKSQLRVMLEVAFLAPLSMLVPHDGGRSVGAREQSGSSPMSLSYWDIEPYYMPILNHRGRVDRYERQTGCYLIINRELKKCLSFKQDKNKGTFSLHLVPYEQDRKIEEYIWFFEEVLDDSPGHLPFLF